MNKFKWFAIILSVIILAIGGLTIFQMEKNYQANKRMIDQCFENFDNEGVVIITKEGNSSPVDCEKP